MIQYDRRRHHTGHIGVQSRGKSWTFRIHTGRESTGAVHQTVNHQTTVEFWSSESHCFFLSLPALFCLLWKSGLSDQDIMVLKQYYDSNYMIITHNDDWKSAHIPLRRGVWQGCPLSHILGCIVINMIIRWVEDTGGDMSHPSGIITEIMTYCDEAWKLV